MRKLEGWKAVVSVPSQRKAWEVYPLEVYYPDDPTRLCRPKAGQSQVNIKISISISKYFSSRCHSSHATHDHHIHHMLMWICQNLLINININMVLAASISSLWISTMVTNQFGFSPGTHLLLCVVLVRIILWNIEHYYWTPWLCHVRFLCIGFLLLLYLLTMSCLANLWPTISLNKRTLSHQRQ